MKSLKLYLEDNATPSNTCGMGNPDSGEGALLVDPKHRTKKKSKNKGEEE